MKNFLKYFGITALIILAVVSMKVTAGLSMATVLPLMRDPDPPGGGGGGDLTVKEIKAQIDKIADGLDAKLDEVVEKAKAAGLESVKGVSEEIKNDLKEQLAKYNEMEKLLTERMDEIETKASKQFKMDSRDKNWGDFLLKTFSDSEEVQKFLKRQAKEAAVDIMKLDDMTQANSFESTDVVGEMRVPGIQYDPDRKEHVRDILAQGVTVQNAVGFIQEYAYTDNTDVTAEGSEYKQGDFDLKLITANVRKITNYVIVSEEMVEDVPGLTSYILARLPKKIKLKEDYQLLYGDGTGNNLYGITPQAAAYVDALADATVTRIDVLADAVRQARVDEYRANWIVIHPTDVGAIRLEKDTTGRYIMPWIFSGELPKIAGVPIFETTAITEGDFLVGDFNLGAQVFDRRQVAIEFSKNNEDNFIKGMMTVRGSERLTICVYRTNAFVYGTFAAALAEGTA